MAVHRPFWGKWFALTQYRPVRLSSKLGASGGHQRTHPTLLMSTLAIPLIGYPKSNFRHFQRIWNASKKTASDWLKKSSKNEDKNFLQKQKFRWVKIFDSKPWNKNFRQAKQKNSTTQMLEKFYLYSKSDSEKIKNWESSLRKNQKNLWNQKLNFMIWFKILGNDSYRVTHTTWVIWRILDSYF